MCLAKSFVIPRPICVYIYIYLVVQLSAVMCETSETSTNTWLAGCSAAARSKPDKWAGCSGHCLGHAGDEKGLHSGGDLWRHWLGGGETVKVSGVSSLAIYIEKNKAYELQWLLSSITMIWSNMLFVLA